MLVLTRKENESIHIGDEIFIKVVRIQGNRVRFAIDAPKDVRIVRGELQVVTPMIETTAEIVTIFDMPVIPLPSLKPDSDAIAH